MDELLKRIGAGATLVLDQAGAIAWLKRPGQAVEDVEYRAAVEAIGVPGICRVGTDSCGHANYVFNPQVAMGSTHRGSAIAAEALQDSCAAVPRDAVRWSRKPS